MHSRIRPIALALLLAPAAVSAQVNPERKVEQLAPPVPIPAAGNGLGGFVLADVNDHTIALSDAVGVMWKHFAIPGQAASAKTTTLSVPPLVFTDAENGIAAIHSPDGKRLGHISIPDATQAVAPFGRGFIVMGAANVFSAYAADSAGVRTGDVSLPASLQGLQRMGASPNAAASRNGWAVALRYTGRILVQRVGDPAPREINVIESRPALSDTVFYVGENNEMRVAKRNPRSVMTVHAIAWGGDMLYALAGTGDTAARYIDVYDSRTLAYVRSYLLPRSVRSLGVNSNGIVVLESGAQGTLAFYPFRP